MLYILVYNWKLIYTICKLSVYFKYNNSHLVYIDWTIWWEKGLKGEFYLISAIFESYKSFSEYKST